jgi:hypothetical protein
MRRIVVVTAAMLWMLSCASELPDTQSPAPLGLKASALSTCDGLNTDPFEEINGYRVVVRRLSGVLPNESAITFNGKFGGGVSDTIKVSGVPEGFDEEVSLLGFAGNEAPSWFGRQKKVVIEQGKDNPVTMVLSKFGGFSCPTPHTEFTHRLFPTVTSLGASKYFITGGLTALNTQGGVSFITNIASKRAFIYDADTGTMTKVGSEMSEERGGHTAVLVRGTEKNRVVIFGGTRTLNYNPAAGNGFAWSFEVKDAVPTVDVFEYDVGGDPSKGVFRADTKTTTLRQKRVFPTADVISTDGLVLICGGGQWGVATKPEEYKECEVWDTPENAFLTLSNNDMNLYRAGLSSALVKSGQVVKLLFYGGTTSAELGEVYTSSSKQKDGVGGSFVKTYIEGPSHSFFQSLTAIGGKRFVALGGVNWNNGSSIFDKPSPENAWLLEYHEVDDKPVVLASQIGGLDVGRYFHVAHAPSEKLLTTLGGFTGNDLSPTPNVRFLSKVGDTYELHPPSIDEESMQARGGMGSILLDNDTILMVGGIGTPADLEEKTTGSFEVYTPSVLYDNAGGVQ